VSRGKKSVNDRFLIFWSYFRLSTAIFLNRFANDLKRISVSIRARGFSWREAGVLNLALVRRKLFTCGGRFATAGFLLSGNKRNKNAWRPFYWVDFLSLAAGPQPQPLAFQARLRGLLYFLSLAALVVIALGRLWLENLMQIKRMPLELPRVAGTITLNSANCRI
jgi:hypothetical protein